MPAEDHPRPRQMAGARNHLGRPPAMGLHDPRRIARVLNGVRACGSITMEDAGTPCASAVRAITSASIKPLGWPPVRIRWGATPRSYSCTASVTRDSWVGRGIPVRSAGDPRTMMASKRAPPCSRRSKGPRQDCPRQQHNRDRDPCEEQPSPQAQPAPAGHGPAMMRPADRRFADDFRWLSGWSQERPPGSTLSRRPESAAPRRRDESA